MKFRMIYCPIPKIRVNIINRVISETPDPIPPAEVTILTIDVSTTIAIVAKTTTMKTLVPAEFSNNQGIYTSSFRLDARMRNCKSNAQLSEFWFLSSNYITSILFLLIHVSFCYAVLLCSRAIKNSK